MVLKSVFVAVICAVLVAATGPSMADGYQSGQFLGLDLGKAALSPKPLGPPAQFEPVPVEARTDAKPDGAEPAVAKIADDNVNVVPAHVAKRPRAARTKLARRHGNPLDAQAFDTRVQVWPCRSGGICNWQRPAQ